MMRSFSDESEHSLEEDAASCASDRIMHLECNGDHSASIRNEDSRKPVSFTVRIPITIVFTYSRKAELSVMKDECEICISDNKFFATQRNRYNKIISCNGKDSERD